MDSSRGATARVIAAARRGSQRTGDRNVVFELKLDLWGIGLEN